MKVREYKVYLDSEGLTFTTVKITQDDIWEFVAGRLAAELFPGKLIHAVELEDEWKE